MIFILVLASMTLTNLANSQFSPTEILNINVSLTVNPPYIVEELVSQVDIVCSFKRNNVPSMASVMSIVLGHSNKTNLPEFNYMASVNGMEGYAHNVSHDVEAISGFIDNNGESKLHMRFKYPETHLIGVFMCEVTGFDQIGKPVSIYNTFNVVTTSITDLVESLHNAQSNISNLVDSLHHAQSNNTGLVEALHSAQSNNTGLIDSLHHAQSNNTYLVEALHHAQSNNTGLVEALHRARSNITDLVDSLHSAQSNNTGLVEALHRARSNVTDLVDSLHSAQSNNTYLVEALHHAQSNNTYLVEALHQAQSNNTDLADTLQIAQSNITNLADTLQIAQSNITNLADTLQIAQSNITNLVDALHQAQSNNTDLADTLQVAQSNITNLADTLQIAQSNITNLVDALRKALSDTSTMQASQGTNVASSLHSTFCGKFHPPIFYNGHVYYLSRTLNYFNRTAMQTTCEVMGGYLIELDTHDEFSFIKDYLMKLGSVDSVYTGATDEEREGVWTNKHNSTSRPSFDWGDGKPDGESDANCQCFQQFVSFYLSDCYCYGTVYPHCQYICEIPGIDC